MSTTTLMKPPGQKRMSSEDPIAQGDLLYHSVHGLCRVDGLIREKAGKKVQSYSLVPKTVSKMKIRFLIPAENLDASGFRSLVSTAEANDILKYLRGGESSAVPTRFKSNAGFMAEAGNEIWVAANLILTFCRETLEIRDQRKRQALERSTKGLIGELAIVLKISLKDASGMVRQSLKENSRIHPQVLTALENASDDD